MWVSFQNFMVWVLKNKCKLFTKKKPNRKTTPAFTHNQDMFPTLEHIYRDVIKYFAKKLKTELLRTEG